jgi:putative membrane protein
MQLITHLLLTTFALLIVDYLIPGVRFESFWATIVSSVLIGVINTFIKPVLQIIFIPLTILTFGLSAFLINVLIIFVVSMLVPGFEIDSFLSAVFASLTFSLIMLFFKRMSQEKDFENSPKKK